MNMKDQIEQRLAGVLIRGGGEALVRATGTEQDWEATPSPRVDLAGARIVAALQRQFGDSRTTALLNHTWMQGERDAAHEFVDHVFNQFELWAMTARPDLLRTGRDLLNDVLPEDERI